MKKIGLILIGIVVIAALVGGYFYNAIFASNTTIASPQEFYIPQGSEYNDVHDILEKSNAIKSISNFDLVAGYMKYGDQNIRTGKYTIKPGMNTKEIVTMLRAGWQTPVRVTLSNARTIGDVCKSLTQNIEIDSATVHNYLSQNTTQLGYKKEDVISIFIPDTYEVYWNISAPKLIDRMVKENKTFWSKKDRLQKAASREMTKEEVYTLASIVESESTYKPEQPTIAGLYLNRLDRGIHLQADPTVVYAVGDFSIRRVLNRHLLTDSPYNTYMNPGLPPGPIRVPTVSAIDAVLDPEQHNYLYMCAKPGYNSQHSFAKTLAQHNNNANIYRKWLNNERIK